MKLSTVHSGDCNLLSLIFICSPVPLENIHTPSDFKNHILKNTVEFSIITERTLIYFLITVQCNICINQTLRQKANNLFNFFSLYFFTRHSLLFHIIFCDLICFFFRNSRLILYKRSKWHRFEQTICTFFKLKYFEKPSELFSIKQIAKTVTLCRLWISMNIDRQTSKVQWTSQTNNWNFNKFSIGKPKDKLEVFVTWARGRMHVSWHRGVKSCLVCKGKTT